jgi:hypothetical protein
METKIQIHHSVPHDLLNPTEREQVIRDFRALTLFVMDGGGKVGYFHRESKVMKRNQDNAATDPSVPVTLLVPEDPGTDSSSDGEAQYSDNLPFFDPAVVTKLSIHDLDNNNVSQVWDDEEGEGEGEENEEGEGQERAAPTGGNDGDLSVNQAELEQNWN